MSEKRMLVVDADLVKKIDENRGELSRSEFIDPVSYTHLTLPTN